MRTKVSEWLEIDSLKMKYGIKVYHNGKWINAKDNDGPLIFDDLDACIAKRKELRSQNIPDHYARNQRPTTHED